MFTKSFNSRKLFTILVLVFFSFSMFNVILLTTTAEPERPPEDEETECEHDEEEKKGSSTSETVKKICDFLNKAVDVGSKISKVIECIKDLCEYEYTEIEYQCSGCCSSGNTDSAIHTHCSSGCCGTTCTTHATASHTPEQAKPSIDFYSSGSYSSGY